MYYYIKLPNSIIDNQYIKENDYFLLVLAVILKNLTISNEYIYTDNYIYEVLKVKKNNDTYSKNKIQDAIRFMLDMDIIKINKVIGDLKYISLNNLDKEYFTVDFDTIDKILQFDNKYKIFNVYCVIRRSINFASKVTFIGQTKMQEITKYSNKTIVKIKKELETKGIINIESIGAVVTLNNQIKNANDYISCTCDDAEGNIIKEKVKFEKEKLSNTTKKIINKKVGNKKCKNKDKQNLSLKRELKYKERYILTNLGLATEDIMFIDDMLSENNTLDEILKQYYYNIYNQFYQEFEQIQDKYNFDEADMYFLKQEYKDIDNEDELPF